MDQGRTMQGSPQGNKPVLTEEQFQLVFAWVDGLVSLAQVSGRELTDEERRLAVESGICQIEKIRIQEVGEMPQPPQGLMALAAIYLDPGMAAGLTLGHVVMVLKGHMTNQLLRHEFCHVQQVERLGGVDPFLRSYIEQVIKYGYQRAPLEVEARQFG
jgi:hypothetical protein